MCVKGEYYPVSRAGRKNSEGTADETIQRDLADVR